MASETANVTSALVALAQAGIPTDVQELLIRGDASRGIAPGAILKALNTRPAPAAADTGLVTYEPYLEVIDTGIGGFEEASMRKSSDGSYVHIDQAEELLAVERAKVQHWQEQYTEMHSQFIDLAKSAEADNAAQAARINGFEGFLDDLAEILGCERDIGDVVNELDAINNRAEALETQLAAAEKALEPFADHANDRAVDDTGWRDKETVKIVVSIGDLRKARATLRGKSS